jgi:hypothetical protein
VVALVVGQGRGLDLHAVQAFFGGLFHPLIYETSVWYAPFTIFELL